MLQAEFVPGSHGDILISSRRPSAPTNDAVLIVPPFGEELNKSRRMMAQVAFGLTERGTACVCADLFGTGDSAGEFSEARWEYWLEDLELTLRWARASGLEVTKILGIRLGCALTAQLLRRGVDNIAQIVLWQPVFEGKRFIDQFLRLRVAASMLDEDQKETITGLRSELAERRVLEVAGYELAGDLVDSIDRLQTEDASAFGSRAVHWFDIVSSADTPVSPAATRAADALRRKGTSVQLEGIVAEPFWTATEIVTSEKLVSATIDAFTTRQ